MEFMVILCYHGIHGNFMGSCTLYPLHNIQIKKHVQKQKEKIKNLKTQTELLHQLLLWIICATFN